jgi:serine/threonine protein kinase/tetratricopeptide (TPR) repeat protein
MNPVADWQQLSALYEAADALDPVSLAAWLAQLRAQSHPLLDQLEQMLAARAQVQRNGFLGSLPRMPVPPEPQAVAWAEGSRIGPYRLVRRLGEGGMAEVWMAQRDDGAFQRTVAIKLLFRNKGSSERDSFAQRFARERDILASLDHPHIAALHDAGVTPAGQPWLALEYIEGQTLTLWCDAQRLDIAARVRLFRQVLLAVQHAHANLVIHRDLKPGNILVTAQGEVRLLDFGIAKLMEQEGGTLAETELTRLAGRPMTPQYAAPEQLLGQPLTTACDVYALGVVLYELLCGERPYELKLDSAAQLEQSILEVEPRGPSRRALTDAAVQSRGSSTQVALRKTLSSDLDAIVLRALAKQPAKRYGSVEAFRADLDHWLAGEPVEARVPSAAYRVSKFVRRHRLAVALGMGAVLSLIGVTVVAVVMGLQAREDSARAGAARDFMLNIFARANQEKSRGADITARDLLETGRKDVLTRLAGQPRLQVELLRGIAKIQSEMGEYASADGTYAELVRLLAALHEPRQEAWARADHADNAYQMNTPSLAATLLQQAKNVRNRPAKDPEMEARFSELDGWISIASGDAASARERLQSARKRSTDLLGAEHLRTFREGQLRDFDAALTLHEQLARVAKSVVGLDADEQAAMNWDHVRLLQDAGRLAQALDLVETVLPQCNESLGTDEQFCRLLFISRGSVFLRLGLVERASRDLPRLAALSKDQTWPYVRVEAMLMRFRLASRVAPIAELSAIEESVRAFGQSGSEIPMNPVFKATALLALAESSLLRGRAHAAQDWVEQANAKLREAREGAVNIKFAALSQELMGVAQLHQGDAKRALSSLIQADSQFSASLGADHPVRHLMALNTALALDALGRPSEALAIVARSEPALKIAFGSATPTYQRVAALLRRLQIRVTHADPIASDPDAIPGRASHPSPGAAEFFS